MPPDPRARGPLSSTVSPRTAPASGKPAPRPGASAKPPVASAPARLPSTRRADQDQVLVSSVIVAFLLLTLAAVGVKVRGNARTDRSRAEVSGTLTRVYDQQTAFRLLNQRFATWPELEAQGMALPTSHRVLASNASPSHWFMKVRDTNTGVVCSRTGELFDEDPSERPPTCVGEAP